MNQDSLNQIVQHLADLAKSIRGITQVYEHTYKTTSLSKPLNLVAEKKFLKKEKKYKDPNAPKAPLSSYIILYFFIIQLFSYILFSTERRAQFIVEHPDANFTDIGRLTGAAWKAINPNDKKVYDDRALKLKNAYNKELQEYKIGEKRKLENVVESEYESNVESQEETSILIEKNKIESLEGESDDSDETQPVVKVKKSKKTLASTPTLSSAKLEKENPHAKKGRKE